MLTIQAVLPNHVELPERSGRLQSPWRKVLGGPAALASSSYAGQPKKYSAAHQNCRNRRSKQKPNCQASSSASCWVIPGLSYIPLTHWPTSITRQFHPADPPLRGRDKGEPVTRGDSLPQPVLGRLGGKT
ncbi:hypothetical protein PCANC_21399 [Puccinia coronata f. sp. avenae]|uniref:Uncharacterized protein n=1 Tax=Puccinia coronata f. sp. avenae TaxID=200324 RepID=A0A2N5UTQ8_9BASI|nr:hypothetical protein PCANC_26952 [Puccinia coronata f. sp. avenae]PLW41021.1 hypothetical protein PCANC_21400 [Puccinia coronata f. sp. avenae]PLW41026.1 hypothetical protein PCANC_21399 [Puccinia coronata f. sp. avenae]